MRQTTHVPTDDRPFGAKPARQLPRLVTHNVETAFAIRAEDAEPVDLDEGRPEIGVLAHPPEGLMHEVQHGVAEINVLQRVEALVSSEEVDNASALIIEERVRRNDNACANLADAVRRELECGVRLRDRAEALETWYREENARLIEELAAQSRRERRMEQDLERHYARVRPKRKSRGHV